MANHLQNSPEKARAHRRLWFYGIGSLVLAVLLLLVREVEWSGSANLHTLMEALATTMALLVGVLALVRFYSRKDNTFLLIGTGFIGAALLDSYHTLVHSPVPFTIEIFSSDPITLFPLGRIASRLFLSMMMVLSWLVWRREARLDAKGRLRDLTVYLVAGALTLAIFLFFAFTPPPESYLPNFYFNRPGEIIPAVLFGVALIGYLRKGYWRDSAFEHWLVFSLITGFISQTVFITHTPNVIDFEFELAHLLKNISYFCVLTGLLINMFQLFRQAETGAAEIQVRESRLRAVMDNVDEGIVTANPMGILESANAASERIFGYQPGGLLGVNAMNLLPPTHRSRAVDYIESFKDSPPFSFQGVVQELEGLRLDGGVFPMELSVTNIHDGTRRYFIGVVRDITERRKAEEELLQSRQLLQTVFDTVPYWIFVKDRGARYLMVNTIFSEFFGLTPEDFIGKTISEIDLTSDPAEIQRVMEIDQEVMRRNEPMEATFNVRRLDGSLSKRKALRLPITSSEGHVTGLVGLSEDITNKEQAEQGLRQAQKMEAVGELTSGVAHDFNNILQIVGGYAQMATADKDLKPKTAEHLKKVVEATERATKLTRQLLTFSRKSALKTQPMDLNAIIANMDKMIRIVTGVNIHLDHHPGEGLGVVMVDPGMIEQVLLNLCINARDVMPRGGAIDIATLTFEADEDFVGAHAWKRPGRYVEVSVADTGAGMTQEVRDRIFEPFFTTKAPGKGTGLGLAMVYGIIQQHEGEIVVETEPGQGTTFRLYFPEMSSNVTEPREKKIASPKGGA